MDPSPPPNDHEALLTGLSLLGGRLNRSQDMDGAGLHASSRGIAVFDPNGNVLHDFEWAAVTRVTANRASHLPRSRKAVRFIDLKADGVHLRFRSEPDDITPLLLGIWAEIANQQIAGQQIAGQQIANQQIAGLWARTPDMDRITELIAQARSTAVAMAGTTRVLLGRAAEGFGSYRTAHGRALPR